MIELLFSQLWPYLALIAAGIAAFVGVRQSGKSTGRQEVRNEINETQAKARKESRRVEDENASLDDADVDSRLDKWVRNK